MYVDHLFMFIRCDRIKSDTVYIKGNKDPMKINLALHL